MGLEIRTRKAARLSVILLTILACAGCAGIPSTTITANDPHVFNPSVSAAFDLNDGPQSHATPLSGHAIQIEAGRSQGSGTQTLASGQAPVIINNTTFNAPQQLSNDFDFYYADLAYRYRKFFGERQSVGIEATGGLGYASLGLAVSSATQHDAGRFGNAVGKGSFAFIWRMRQTTSVHIRLGTMRSLGIFTDNAKVSAADRFDLYVAQALGDNVSLRAGYTSWAVSGSTGPGSDFNINFGGPMLDLGCNF